MNTIEWIAMQILNCSYEDIHGKVEVRNIRKQRVLKNERNSGHKKMRLKTSARH